MAELYLLQLYTIIKAYTSEVYLVGGCVRDQLLNMVPKDYDLVTDYPIEYLSQDLVDNGWKVSEAGKSFMVLHCAKGGHKFEVANFRKDVSATEVVVGTIEDDAFRRDFTINALYLNPTDGSILDPTGYGLRDIHNRLLRFVGRPNDRIQEDPLRIMRFYRIAAQLGLIMEKRSLVACRRNFDMMVRTVSSERIRLELEKLWVIHE